MSTVLAGNVLADQMAKYKQRKEGLTETPQAYLPQQVQPILIKPTASSWEDLEQKLKQVINLPGLWITVSELYDQGYGAELETAAEIALAKYKKGPCQLFATMVSKKAGNWATRTLQMVRETWEIRRNALQVMEKLKLKAETAKVILGIAWRLKGSIMHYLGLATEQGTGIKNPAGVFFALTKKKRQPATA